jgi:hypothetical protein
MLIKLAEFFWFFGTLSIKQLNRKVRLYIYKNIALGVVMLAVILIGVFIIPLASIALVLVGVILGPWMLMRVWAGVSAADIAQELLPESKKEEIKTIKYVAIAGTVILFFISPLLFPIIWYEQITKDISKYHLLLFCWIVLGYTMLSSKQQGAKK